MKIKLIKGSFNTDSDFSKFNYDAVLDATDEAYGADVRVSSLEAEGAVIDTSGADITEYRDVFYFYFSAGAACVMFNEEYEVVEE
jgi:hypothetical protein